MCEKLIKYKIISSTRL